MNRTEKIGLVFFMFAITGCIIVNIRGVADVIEILVLSIITIGGVILFVFGDAE